MKSLGLFGRLRRKTTSEPDMKSSMVLGKAPWRVKNVARARQGWPQTPDGKGDRRFSLSRRLLRSIAMGFADFISPTSLTPCGHSKSVARQKTEQFPGTQSIRLPALRQFHDVYRNRSAKPSSGLRSSSPTGRVFIKQESD